MSDSPKKKRVAKRDRKEPVRMTDDELMDELFSPKVREELKKVAHENRPKSKKRA